MAAYMQRFKLDTALEIICRDLAIKPVPLFVMPLRGAGAFHILKDGGARIIIDVPGCQRHGTDITATLVHEAWHLKQWRDGRLDGNKWTGQPRIKWTEYLSYEDWPWEIEAFEFERRVANNYRWIIE